MRKALIVSTFLFVNLSVVIAVASLLMLNSVTKTFASQQYLPESSFELGRSYDSYSAIPQVGSEQSTTEIIAGDARSLLIENFFRAYHSPMQGLGSKIVQTADTYGLPFGLLPAIAQCEGNLGKVMPHGSFNTWGWAIYGERVHKFKSWDEAIEKVSSGLRKNYFDKGLNSPEEIMKKYTPSSNGSWADCVSQFLEELK